MMSIQDLVTEIRASAVCWENAGAGEPDAFEAYYRRDANEMRHVAALLESGKSRAARLDTEAQRNALTRSCGRCCQ